MSDISSAVLSYLETLSREKLIELINYFAATHEDIRCILEEKAGAVSTKAEPADIFAQSPPELPAADISTTSSQVLVTRNSTPQEKSIYIHRSLSADRMSLRCAGTTQTRIKAVIRRYAKTSGRARNAI